jgi:hypothetical protein
MDRAGHQNENRRRLWEAQARKGYGSPPAMAMPQARAMEPADAPVPGDWQSYTGLRGVPQTVDALGQMARTIAPRIPLEMANLGARVGFDALETVKGIPRGIADIGIWAGDAAGRFLDDANFLNAAAGVPETSYGKTVLGATNDARRLADRAFSASPDASPVGKFGNELTRGLVPFAASVAAGPGAPYLAGALGAAQANERTRQDLLAAGVESDVADRVANEQSAFYGLGYAIPMFGNAGRFANAARGALLTPAINTAGSRNSPATPPQANQTP